MNRDPWLHFWGTDDSSGRTAIVECLNTAGIRHRVFDQSAESGDGILCIPQISEPQASADVCEFLRELTQNGRRVLTVQTGGAAADTAAGLATAARRRVGCSGVVVGRGHGGTDQGAFRTLERRRRPDPVRRW